MVEPPGRDAARAVLHRAIAQRVFPAAVVEAGASEGVLWRESFGRLTFEEGAPSTSVETIFDLASLTKPIATTAIALQQLSDGLLDLREAVAAFFPEWRGPDREAATVQDLLEHASGLAARLVDAPPEGRREFEHDICTMRLEYAPRSRSVYSDLGFILLGFLLEDRRGEPLPSQFRQIETRAIGGPGEALTFGVPPAQRAGVAPTLPLEEDVRRGRTLAGEVHDPYAAALGGAAGHAGLFGTAEGLGAHARTALRGARGDRRAAPPLSAELMARATKPSAVPHSSRALGWDTMRPTSSCGTRMSPRAFGHTGFTGVSLWLDPERDRYFVLLTNRACGAGTLDEMRAVRRAFHDALGDF
jgi:CubicO group peptidase (beta-lactamase class C family)